MRPAKLSANVFLELPPVLTHYVENVRNLWIEGNPKQGKLSLLNRQGVFSDIESLAVARRQLIEVLGLERARALCYRIGFEQGRRDAARHLRVFGQNARLTLQGGPVFRQLQGRGIATSVKFEFDLDARTLYRELTLRDSTEAMAHRVAVQANEDCACWTTAGYLSGHVSEILGRRVVTLETSCGARGDELCRFVSRFDPEWGNEVHWVRKALDMPSVDSELAEREAVAAKAQTMARRAQGRLNDLNRRLRSDLIAASVVADSPVMEPVMALVRRAMASEAPVLFVGERGVGCETLAQAIHYGSKRKAKPLITVDCKGLPEPMLLQELIGFNKGAFAGAVRGHTGALVRANGGTLYLNDISRLSVETQGHLLTALEESQVRPIGADKPTKTDIRLIGATREDPKDLLASGALREAFYYALAVLPIPVPPLRERGADILGLAESFLAEFGERYDRPNTRFSEEFKRALLDCDWPGNVRQLRNVIEHAVIIGPDAELPAGTIPEEVLASRWRGSPPRTLSEEAVRAALRQARGRRGKAASQLGIGRTTLWRLMKRMGIEEDGSDGP